jgi:Uma2 family endonuclease
MAAPIYYTADMVRALPEDGNRYEVVYGELVVTPAPRPWHEVIQCRLMLALGAYLSRHPVVPLEQARTLDWSRMHDLMLVAEILSPSSAHHDRFLKRRRYQEADVPLYWIVDADERRVEVWAPTDTLPRFERERLVWHPPLAAEPFSLPLAELFRPI